MKKVKADSNIDDKKGVIAFVVIINKCSLILAGASPIIQVKNKIMWNLLG
ncbi:hypothetical protein GLV98_10890 [Halobacillus litoralis]|uniref:Uncharacterized protein n=1 Tax=Halobacillus litoralis TaxID=45668 RepID=A0A845E5M4_9BACI|nr:hypothetical protein [Halobacillus litoralis]MYL49993.1 hypothetical protein [Halobacillus litoralis]